MRKYRADYNNNPPNAVSFIPAIVSTSGRLHSEFVRLLFLQAHRETDRFFAASGVPLAQSTSGGFFHFRRAVFFSNLKSKSGNLLAKAATLREKKKNPWLLGEMSENRFPDARGREEG
jgi:hypothetical protein